jgi:restriction system protein
MSSTYYYKVITNPYSGQAVRITAADRFSLANKIERQEQRWERERVRELKAEKKQQALDKTIEAENDLRALNNILQTTIEVDDKIDWNSLLQKDPFPTPEPQEENYHQGSLSKSLSFIGAFKKRADEQYAKERADFEKAHSDYTQRLDEWNSAQKEHNSSLARKKISYESGVSEGVEGYLDLVMDRSAATYPDVININSELMYDEKTKTLLVEVDLPDEETIPKVEAYRYIAARDTIEPKMIAKKQYVALYDNVLYQIMLRFIHEIFESDYKGHVSAVVLNGNSKIRNKGTGGVDNKTIATIQVLRDEFLAVNLANIEPSACFRHFKGVTAGSLVELAPIKPIMKIDKSDNRIIKAANILEEFDPTQNLATMEWEKFEVLIRDLIQKEFGDNGSTVEVTRASRDAGVDAIAFDEDPIRGGKFVIQAKRYNNLVPVSAVRDLYGTVVNEGAVKGILVTTSYYGPDAISFAKDKPLTLINGEQLLYLLQKHGHDFKIELTKKRAASSKTI